MPLDPGLQILANYRSWHKSVEVCSGLGGKVAIGRTENSRNEMKELVREHPDSCGGGLFLGYTDLATEGEWKDWETGEPLPADIGELWAPSEPNGLGWEGCMETGLAEGGLVHDVDCVALHCTIRRPGREMCWRRWGRLRCNGWPYLCLAWEGEEEGPTTHGFLCYFG